MIGGNETATVIGGNDTATVVVGGCTEGAGLELYQDTLYVAIASLPGNVVGVLLINIIGGRILLGESRWFQLNVCI